MIPRPLILSDGFDEYSLEGHFACLEDPTGALTINHVASPEYETQFRVSPGKVPNFGYTDSAYWVRFQAVNHAETQWRLKIGHVYFNDIRLFVPADDKSGFTEVRSGNLIAIPKRSIPIPSYETISKPTWRWRLPFVLRYRSTKILGTGVRPSIPQGERAWF